MWGLEIEGSTSDLDGNARCAFALYICNSRIDYMGTLTGRVGFAFDHALLYVKGGGAYAHDTYLMPASTSPRVFTADDRRPRGRIRLQSRLVDQARVRLHRLGQSLHRFHRSSAVLGPLEHCDRPDAVSHEGGDQLQGRLGHADPLPGRFDECTRCARGDFHARNEWIGACGPRMDHRSRRALLVQLADIRRICSIPR